VPDRGSRLAAWGAALLALLLVLPCPAACDQFILKDGRKISGALVGYQNGMFRVQTEFGFALIRKDKVSRVIVESEQKSESRHSAPASPPPASSPGASAQPAEVSAATPASPRPALAAPPAISRPLDALPPAHIREHVVGNNYVNDTFHFTMFKPPDWKLYEELNREKVSAIVAMSSDDNRTLLFVDRQVWSGPPDLGDDRVEARLRSTYQDYKKLSQSPLRVDGLPALRTAFTGVLDNVEWHGVSVRIARGNTVFAIVGLTSAGTYDFQLAVFNKIIKTFRFVSPSPPPRAALGEP
jgi:hypothetical protein